MQKRRHSSSVSTLPTTFPQLNMEAQDSLISIDPNDVPPTKDQVMAIARNVYGFEGLDAGRVTVKHFDPLVLEVEGFFSEEECDKYVAMSKVGVESPVVGNDKYSKEHRKSKTFHHRYSESSELLGSALDILGLENTEEELGRFEEPQTVLYEDGDYFSWHLDALGMSSDEVRGSGGANAKCGQRVVTMLVYLNDVPEGGRTCFRDLKGCDVKPEKGKAVIFFPSLGGIKGCPADIRTLHKDRSEERR